VVCIPLRLVLPLVANGKYTPGAIRARLARRVLGFVDLLGGELTWGGALGWLRLRCDRGCVDAEGRDERPYREDDVYGKDKVKPGHARSSKVPDRAQGSVGLSSARLRGSLVSDVDCRSCSGVLWFGSERLGPVRLEID
jgi:hypothetical protein